MTTGRLQHWITLWLSAPRRRARNRRTDWPEIGHTFGLPLDVPASVDGHQRAMAALDPNRKADK